MMNNHDNDYKNNLEKLSESQEPIVLPPNEPSHVPPAEPLASFSSDPYPSPGLDSHSSVTNQPKRTDPAVENNPFHAPYSEQPPHPRQNGEKSQRGKSKGLMIVAGILIAIMLFGAGGLFGNFYQLYRSENQGIVSQDEDKGKTAEDTAQLEISSTPSVATEISSGGALSGREIYKKVSASVVGVIVTTNSYDSGSGTGIVMTEDGYIITNYHVVQNAAQADVVLENGKRYAASIIGTDEKTDLAVLKIEPDEALAPAEFGNSDLLEIGDPAYAIGNPSGLELQNSMTAGCISAINRNITIDDRILTLIQTDVSINPGNSGGPLINQYGQVVGIITAKLGISYYEGLGFAIPISNAQSIINELIQNGKVTGRPAIGISGRNISKEIASFNRVPQGLYVDAIDYRSDAAAQGLQVGDIIVGVNGQATTNMAQINAIKEDFKAGDSLTLNVYRSGRYLDITIVLVDEAVFSEEETTEENPAKGYYNFPYDSNGNRNGFFGLP